MNFIEAVKAAAKEGKALKRLSWTGPSNWYVMLPTNTSFNMMLIPTKENPLQVTTTSGNWNPTTEEILADDWVLSDWEKPTNSR